MVPGRPGHPVMIAMAMGVPGEIGVPVGVGADGTPEQAATMVPGRPGHPVMVAARMGVPGEIGVECL